MFYVKWLGCVAAVFVAFEILQIPLRKKNKKVVFGLLCIIKLMAAIVVAYCSMAFNNKFVWNLGYVPAALYGVLLCDAFADLAALVIRHACHGAGIDDRYVRRLPEGHDPKTLLNELILHGFGLIGVDLAP